MSYATAARAALVRELGTEYACEPELVDLYTLLVLVKSEEVTLKDVHDAWSIWRLRTQPDHPSIVPFEELEKSSQDYDLPYAQAIRRAARSV
jgi:hypothetical protein